MRTSRNAWGASLDSTDAIMEWELGSRAMEGIEAENRGAILAEATVRLRASRAQLKPPYREGDEYLDHLVTVKGRVEELYFCYDVAEDGRLMCTIIDPPQPENTGGITFIPPELVEDSVYWAKEDTNG